MYLYFFFEWYGDHRDLHVLTHSFPTRRSSDLFLGRVDDALGDDIAFHDAAKDVDEDTLDRRVLQDDLERRGDLFLVGAAADVQEIGREGAVQLDDRSEEHTSELQSLMRTSYAVFCLKKKKKQEEPAERINIISQTK